MDINGVNIQSQFLALRENYDNHVKLWNTVAFGILHPQPVLRL